MFRHLNNLAGRPQTLFLAIVLATSILLHFTTWLIAQTELGEFRLTNYPVHSTVETAGCMIAFLVAGILIRLELRGMGTHFNVRLAGALTCMGVLDGLHSLVYAGQAFVWLHSLSTFAGGLLFALIWIPNSWGSRVGWWHWTVASIAMLAGIGSLAMPEWIPQMVTTGGIFTATAIFLNLAGGVLFFAAVCKLLTTFIKTQNIDDMLFCLHCVMFGLAALMFQSSDIWDISWWGWHILRLLAYGVALFFVINSDEQTHKVVTQDLRNVNVALEQSVQQSQEELKRNEERFRQLAEHIDELFWIAKVPSLEIEYISPAYEKIWGRPSRRSYPDWRQWFEWVHPDDRQRVMESFKKNSIGGHYDETYRILRPDGSLRWVRARGFPIENSEGAVYRVVGIVEDITEYLRTQQIMSNQADELKRSNRELESFAYIASHDLKEPLRMVSSYTQLLAEDFEGQLGDDADKYIHFATDGAARMTQLIDALLQYSRVGRANQTLEEVDLNEVLRTVQSNLALAIHDANGSVSSEDLPTITAYRSEMIQLFQNLIGNALKFRGEKDSVVTISCQTHDQIMDFTVADNGIGIDPAFSDKIFNVFQRLHSRRDYAGTGIGLAVCKKIIEQRGGRIWVESSPGQGTKFHFSISKRPVELADPFSWSNEKLQSLVKASN